jgi:hypothetical protein
MHIIVCHWCSPGLPVPCVPAVLFHAATSAAIAGKKRPREPVDASEEYIHNLLETRPRAEHLRSVADLRRELELPLPSGLLTHRALPGIDLAVIPFTQIDRDTDLTTNMLEVALLYPYDQTISLSSEEAVASNADLLTGAIWRTVKRLHGEFNVEDACNRHDPSGATGHADERPRHDYCLWYGNALLLKAEHKFEGDELSAAIGELRSKMAGGWNTLALRGLPFLLCYVAAGAKVQFVAVVPPAHAGGESTTAVLTMPYDTSSATGKFHVMRCALNAARVLCTLASLVPQSSAAPA